MSEKPVGPPRSSAIHRLADPAYRELSKAFNELWSVAFREICSDRIPGKEQKEILDALRECREAFHGLSPDAPQKLVSLSQRFHESVTCRAIIEKIWKITTLK
jgi:hypothetical protein